MSASISNYVRIKGDKTAHGRLVQPGCEMNVHNAGELYRELQFGYPKFFKMDVLCKWAWLGAECLLSKGDRSVYGDTDKNKIALVLATAEGCLDVDKKYKQSMADIASPALFVYTLPNIMLGEICIRHKFKGEQACMVSEVFDADEIYFWVNDMVNKRGMEACICGYVDATEERYDVCLFWVTKNGQGVPFSSKAMQEIYKSI